METERKYFGYSKEEVLDAFHSMEKLVSSNPKRLNLEKSTLEILYEISKNLTEENKEYIRKLVASDLSSQSQTSKSTEWKKEDFIKILEEDIEE